MLKQPHIPEFINVREYQKEAIRSWLTAKGHGILEMATGSGKTITSICAIIKLLQQYRTAGMACGLIIVLPYKVLLEQWGEILASFGIIPLACYESKSIWLRKLEKQVELFNTGHYNDFFVVTTNTTFYSNDFQNQLNKIVGDYIFCIDEMHHFATEQGLSKLPEQAKFKIGLSATLLTKWENKSMDALINYFGGIVYTFPLERAIDEGFLTPYNYHPVFVELTSEEKEEYFILSKKIAKIYLSSKDNDDNEALQMLLLKRARIISSAENKLEVLRGMRDLIYGTGYNLFYCGDSIEADGRYVEKVNRILSFEFNMKTHTFTAEESKSQRSEILRSFADGNIEALTAIRCLDEGVDIPSLRRAFILASGTNPKEFIQRRGRILRKSPGKELAEVYDFFVVPTMQRNEIVKMDSAQIASERRILNREFDRFKEFADLALNKQEAYSKIIDIWALYNR